MMSRPMLLVFLLLILIITSQFEWRQPLVNDIDTKPAVNPKQLQISKWEEGVKEKIILSQEKNIHRLNELVRSLKQQLLQCKCTNEPRTGPSGTLTERIIELERQQILED
ncbi:hypothetical protein POPTR_004G200200v4 [Populus trichocarpa]|uniref:Uncharacterized protein n=8 Tax=Populus TaxID=3689 RepID=B9MYU8_POPTR|nr:uncharacterized protein LOC18098095 [Populus trichocarpa]XP_006384782.1 uncharacterized protein LOC18098095 [Populus trichocarpa]XP_011006672.1 PREDICTED: uncharacterized protein LOC105112619 [Populus euphratica]XP_011006682.1 PREDICTED: uncharacterized protein LOC105112619 [Populus euphratica]XP_034901390.1 uncharacterized protein LOC118038946 [Populus alba]XP_034901391.1 uncharacterized protein LOC118038946 [Populus alba]XP_061977845.1 uncharacterized protein LOC133698794 [Populus nigra]|eukprot:XP_006384781.1 uncharacterized protein LOC18098095 [Populus trichocarpa]